MSPRSVGWVVAASILAVAALFPEATEAGLRAIVLADFESGQANLVSYDPEQDQQPDHWELATANTYGGSLYSLRIFGNTWKAQPIAPYQVERETVLRVAAYIEEIGEIQAFGISDGQNVLFYTFSGSQLPTGTEWEVEYQGAFPVRRWNLYYLPVGRDWETRYGYQPSITSLVYVNDRDGEPKGITLFDDVLDVTEDLPEAPQATIIQGRQSIEKIGPRLFRVGIQFHAQVYDPDSDTFIYRWDFGDSTGSAEADPFHEFTVASDRTYTVTLSVRDDTELWGRDSVQVRVDPGGPEGPSTMNFVGDVMLARRYEQPGGAIYQYGPEYIFIPTRPIFGDAADISICNLESPLTDEGEPHPTKSYVFRGSPENVAGLVYAGIDVVSIGNNHIVDYGQRGMEETQEVLDAAGIRWSGADDNEYLALQPTYWTESGVALAFLGMCNRTGREWNYQPFLDAAYNKPGFAYLIEPNVTDAIVNARRIVDLVVIQPHAGIEYATDPGALFGIPEIEPPHDAPGPFDGMTDFVFPTRPSLSDRQLRWRAVEAGADLVVCHHPHVLQGFEFYQGVLIAHSLGNFAFDQTYAETFPSLVLYTEFEKEGLLSYSFRPVFIDDTIPRPASGRLAREILDRQAEYSRELETTVTVDPITMTGTVHPDPAEVVWIPESHERTVPLSSAQGFWISSPIERDGLGVLAEVRSVEAPGVVEVRVGREILWHGGFEAEGATLWNLNSNDEVYDATVAFAGARSLRLRRTSQNSGAISTELEGRPVTLGGRSFSVAGWIRTQNAAGAMFQARIYANRTGNAIGTYDAGTPLSGTNDWTFFNRDIEAPAGGLFFNLYCRADRPASGEGLAWFDEIRLIEWEPWLPASAPVPVALPSNLRFLQVRTDASAPSARMVWEDRVPAGLPTQAPEASASDVPRARIGRIVPNPFRGGTAIEYRLTRPGKIRLEVFDIGGRRVGLLEDRFAEAGIHRTQWKSEGIGSGIYLCRLTVGGETWTEKLVHLK